nr:DUF2513 domain-containing protein [uncultured Rhodopila sp.]
MKRDMDLVRDILLKIESAPGKSSWNVLIDGVEGEDKQKLLLAHLPLMRDAHLVKFLSLNAGIYTVMENIELTWEGHDLLDSVRSPEVWKKTKKGVEAAGGFTIDLMKSLAKGFVKKQIEEHTGVKLEL